LSLEAIDYIEEPDDLEPDPFPLKENEPEPEPTPEPTPEPAPEPTPEPTPEPSPEPTPSPEPSRIEDTPTTDEIISEQNL
jgi:hypothetical protein